MSVMKEIQFPVSVRWRGGRLALADAPGKRGLELATPPEFTGGLAGYWNPEDMLVASAASCYALTLAAVAERRGAPLLDATVTATGHMTRRNDGRFGFTLIEVDAALETIPGGEEAVASAAAAAEERCLITQALEIPVQVDVKVDTVSAGAAPGRVAAYR
jgi:organic hydroperoxide reductase OsmC/OhrA